MLKKEKSSFFIIATPLIVVALTAVTIQLKTPKTIVKGVIDLKNLPQYKTYLKNQIDSYAPEPTWQPVESEMTKTQPKIAGKAGILVELNTSKIVAKKNIDERRKIASLVKIMTAIIALEHKDLNDKVIISKKAANIGENTMGLTQGETYTLEELLYGLILHSGNDAAYAISEAVGKDAGGSTKTFVSWMNIKAHELGLNNTYFADPSGLDDMSYSTPRDLVKLTKYALKNPKFRKIVKTVETELISNSHKYVYLYNQTNLLTTYPGVAGVKTGYTEDAGLCLVTYAQNNGVELIGVVLDSVDRRGDMIMLLDHGFSSLGIEIQHNLL